MKKKTFITQKTARFFQLGEFTSTTKNVYIALHGYAQLANYFLKWFEPLLDNETVIIAPEGLHRFYWNGFSGRVVASWMTKEDRLDDISDYNRYLNNLMDQIPNENYNVHLIGFSQGAATALRWVTLSNPSITSLTLWAGAFPEDIDYFEHSDLLNQLHLHVIIGDKDEYYNQEKINQLKNHLNQHQMNYTFIDYNGNHKVYKEPLIKLKDSLSMK